VSEYKLDAPEWIVRDMTFREYVNVVKRNFEQSNTNRKFGQRQIAESKETSPKVKS
jgi:hypothetical protein